MPKRNLAYYMETHGEHGEACYNAVETIAKLSKEGNADTKRLLKCFRSWISKCYCTTNCQHKYFENIFIYPDWLVDPQQFLNWVKEDPARSKFSLVRVDKSIGFHPDNLIPREPKSLE